MMSKCFRGVNKNGFLKKLEYKKLALFCWLVGRKNTHQMVLSTGKQTMSVQFSSVKHVGHFLNVALTLFLSLESWGWQRSGKLMEVCVHPHLFSPHLLLWTYSDSVYRYPWHCFDITAVLNQAGSVGNSRSIQSQHKMSTEIFPPKCWDGHKKEWEGHMFHCLFY